MTNLLLFLILIVQVVIAVMLKKALKLEDFSNEDAQIMAMTEQTEEAKEQVKEAKGRLPKQ